MLTTSPHPKSPARPGAVRNALSRVRRATLATAAAFLAAIAVAGPASAHCGCPHTVDIMAVDPLSFQVDTHGTVPAGLVQFRFWNDSAMSPHQEQLFRLNDGVSFQQWQDDLHGSDPNKALSPADIAATGGATPVLPGSHQTNWQVLQGGTYVVACFVAGPDGVPHIFKGMYASFDVEGTLTPGEMAELRPDEHVLGTVQAHDPLTYSLPPVLHDGGVYRFENAAAMDVHELNLGKLLPGKTVDDAKAWFAELATPAGPSDPPPFTFMGGNGAENPGTGGWFRVNADPGDYVAFCLVPDDKTGIPHAALGMVVGVTVD